MQKIIDYISANSQRFQDIYFDLLRIPSVSADPKYKPEIEKAAKFLEKLLTEIGLKTEIIQTEGNPLVYAETPPIPGAPVLLFYGHYDVQPAEYPDKRWNSDPFKPEIRGENVFARGANDDKGQFLTHVFGAESVLKTEPGKKVQLKFLLEGEEESVGSISVSKFLESVENRKKLACDCIVVSDTSMFGEDQPAITYGLRGIAAVELFLTGPSRDLHSGDFGGTLFNPGIALAKMLAGLIDENGVVQVPGFYDDVQTITELEKEGYDKLNFDEKEFFGKIDVDKSFGEKGYTTLERRWARPTFDINGITCGYQGEGSKTIIPAKASAKFTFRLVPSQDPEKIVAAVREKLETLLPPGIK
ncbi:MAG: M20/M25/M40 family metallo-hydrolase, partial [Thermoguttaceae bacterium]